MKPNMNLNAVNQYPKGTNIYTEGEPLSSIALVIKGHVVVHHKGTKYMMGSGSFLAVSDITHGRYQSTYTAMEDLIIYVFAIEHMDDLENILSINSDYNGFLIMSMNNIINELDKCYRDIVKRGHALYNFLADKYKFYFESASRRGYKVIRPEWVGELSPFTGYADIDFNKINYYKEYIKVPLDAVKSLYSYSNIITLYQLEEQIELIHQQNDILKEYAQKLIFMSECLIDESDTSLFGLLAAYAIEVVNADGNSDELMDILDSIIEEINRTEALFNSRLGSRIAINHKRMKEAYHLINTGTRDKEISAQTYLKYSVEDSEKVITELSDSFQQIINYSGIDKDASGKIQSAMMDFVNLKDKYSTDDGARKIRKRLTDGYYGLYKHVFLKAYHDENVPRIIDMFLKYGYADERLLTNEQLIDLYFLKDDETSTDIKVYNIKEWLTLIYEGKKEPSKNEFDQEYNEVLLTMKGKGQITDSQVRELVTNMEQKLDHEIQNLFRYTNKLVSGQITTFVPVLHKDSFISQPDRAYITPSIINEAFGRLLDIDYSVFDREILYMNAEKKIEKEYIIERVYPDIILMPAVGSNSIMWQDITGKRRSSPGRFIFPIFCESELYANIVKSCGRFRWEMCRTIEGTAWNNIKHKSLTSEYSDYLQFYKKNRDLSEDKKEKIKLQIQKGRNNSREIFVIDYETWINYEARGAIKLNKIARELLATYCPFSKKTREQLNGQPIFDEAYARYKRNRLKKVREIEGRYRLLQKDKIELTKELVDTLEYYKETQ